MNDKYQYIESKADVMGGVPVIKGTRIPVERIMFLFQDGYNIDMVQAEYPHVSMKKLKGILDDLYSNLEPSLYAQNS